MNNSQCIDTDPEERFAFGENWKRFLSHLNEARISGAKKALTDMLGLENMAGKSFLDIGSGSGLSSLVARQLGARVHSFDYDPQSVVCTAELKKRFYEEDDAWYIEQGSALDKAYLQKLGTFDVVYSWGVLHHSGSMWKALENAALPVCSGGLLFVALYNDQGWISRYWTAVKRLYNKNTLLRRLMITLHAPYLFCARWLARALTGRLDIERGMSLWHDMLDWLGGYPFEVATSQEVIGFYEGRGFKLIRQKVVGHRHGCNQFVFKKGDQ